MPPQSQGPEKAKQHPRLVSRSESDLPSLLRNQLVEDDGYDRTTLAQPDTPLLTVAKTSLGHMSQEQNTDGLQQPTIAKAKRRTYRQDESDGDSDEFEAHFGSRSASSSNSQYSEDGDDNEEEEASSSDGNESNVQAKDNKDAGTHSPFPSPQPQHSPYKQHGITMSRSTTHLTPPTSSATSPRTATNKALLTTPSFAPPFYNRPPPPPLPPSPSIRALLRPTPRKPQTTPLATTSTPTLVLPHPDLPPPSTSHTPSVSPEASDAETHRLLTSPQGASTHPIPTSTHQPPPPIGSRGSTIHTHEAHGANLLLLSTLSFALYLFWAYTPSPVLHALGITYYPDRWWALAVPAWLVVGIVWIYVALAGWNTEVLTLGVERLECIVDEKGRVAPRGGVGAGEEEKGKGSVWTSEDWKTKWSVSTDAVMDVPLGAVCEVLYGAGRAEGDEDEDFD